MELLVLALLAALAISLFFVLVGLFQWLWNNTVPELFGLKAIAYWQAFRLLLLGTMLFGGSSLLSVSFQG